MANHIESESITYTTKAMWKALNKPEFADACMLVLVGSKFEDVVMVADLQREIYARDISIKEGSFSDN